MFAHDLPNVVVVAVDVGKDTLAVSVTDDRRQVLLAPFDAAMTRPGLAGAVQRIRAVLPPEAAVRIGLEAAGHYHRPLAAPGAWPSGWELLELNPAHVAEQRRAQGRRRVKTDAIDLEAITELVLAGRGAPVPAQPAAIGQITALHAHRARRVEARTALKNQLLGQLDRTFPGLGLVLPDVLGTRVGRLLAADFADPARLSSLGTERFIRYARTRNLSVKRPLAERLVAAARDALVLPEAGAARAVLAEDLALLGVLDGQVAAVEAQLATLLPASPFPPCSACPAGPPCAPQPTRPAPGTPPAGPAPPRSTGPPGSPRPSTSPPAGAGTGPSAAKAASCCAGP